LRYHQQRQWIKAHVQSQFPFVTRAGESQMLSADQFKIGGGYLLGGITFAVCLYAAWTAGSDPMLQVLICLFGGILGWVIGIVITPLNKEEKKQFSDYARAVTTLISGYLLGKLESIFRSSLVGKALGDHESLALQILLFLICFLVGVLFTFISRKYVTGPEDERRTKREKLLAEVQESLIKLNGLN
jgi:hypothetical protein